MNLQTKAKPEYSETFPYLLKLLAYALNKESQLPDCRGVSWQALYTLAEFHSLASMVSYAVFALPSEQQPKAEILDMFRQHQALALVTDSNVSMETEHILSALSEAGVRNIPVKGYVLKDDYPVPSMRSMTDVDIIYESSMKDDVKAVFASLGYTLEETGQELNFTKPPFYHYELHSDKMLNHVYFCDVLSRGVFENTFLSGRLKPEDSYLFSLCHLSKHFIYGGAGVRMITDIYVFCRKYYENMDKEYLSRELKKLNLTEFECKVRELAFNWFTQPNPNTATLIADYILCACTFGNAKDSYISNAIIREKATGKKQTAFLVYLQKIFVPYSCIATLYPSAGKHKFLYPFCLCAHWFERVFRKRNINTKNLKYYSVSTDSYDAKRLKAVMSEAGLSYNRKVNK